MKEVLIIVLLFVVVFGTCQYIDSEQDPDEVGSHFEYSIKCEGGFKYKSLDRGYILMLNSDGTPLKCNQKRY